MRRAITVSLLGGLMLLATTSAIRADILVAPSTYSSQTVSPFQSNGRYQQVYAASQFPGMIEITSIAFLPAYSCTYSANLTMALGSTTKAVGELVKNAFSTNATSPLTTVVPSMQYAKNMVSGSWWTFTFASPLVYDPTEGNLLLDLTIASLSFSGSQYVAVWGSANGTSQRATPFNADMTGINTRFEYTQIPEPTGIALLGLGAVGLLRRRSR